MRFIHTADWHLGRSFYNTSLIEDQYYVLSQMIDLARDSRPDIFVIAGDIYDRAVPSTEAVKLLDEVLCRLILDVEVPVLLIAGNHDSPQRLQFAARLLESRRLYVFGIMPDTGKFVQMYDEAGAVCFYAMPYAEPSIVRAHLDNESIIDHESAIAAWLERARERIPQFARTVFIGHAFVVGGEKSDSERPMSVGGSGTVNAGCFDGFNYVALGHLHRAQSIGNTAIHYAGSPLKYSFSESAHSKSANLVELDSMGRCEVRRIELHAKRDVRCIEGEMNTLLRTESPDGRDDFIKVRLLDKGAILDPIGKLRDVYPNVMDLERPGLMNEQVGDQTIRRDPRDNDILALFTDFYLEVTGEPLTERQASAFSIVVNKILQSEREASS